MRTPVTLLALSVTALAQGTLSDYQRAARFLPGNDPTVESGAVSPEWLDDSRFWYRRVAAGDPQFILVDARANRRTPALDSVRLAAALSRFTQNPVKPRALFLRNLKLDDRELQFEFDSARWRCSLPDYDCRRTGRAAWPFVQQIQAADVEIKSPDGKWVAFQRDHNLRLRSTVSGEEVTLTTDGAERSDYSSELPLLPRLMASEGKPPLLRPAVSWSPDSKRLITYKLDWRSTGQFTAVQSVPKVGVRPVAFTWPYALPGEIGVPQATPVIYEVASRKRIDVQTTPILALWGGVAFRWNPDSGTVYFSDMERGYQALRVKEINAHTGAVRTVVEERSETFLNMRGANLTPMWKTREALWTSSRDGWPHVYLIDLEAGRLKKQITRGTFAVRSIARVDEKSRTVYITAGGREPGRDPYYQHAYSVALDTGDVRLLTPEDAEHNVFFSPNGDLFVDSYSRVDTANVSVVRAAAGGRVLMDIERGDTAALRKSGWIPPEPFKALADDGKTETFGVIFRPSTLNPAKKYPVIEEIYMGPQFFTAPKAFQPNPRAQAIAELGFIVVMVDGRGMDGRSKALHDFVYKNLGNVDTGLADHIAAIKQLAARYPYMDLNRVGIYGHSAGGYDSTHALLMRPDFYKVAVSSAGNHDHRLDKATWNEIWMGFPAGDHYREQSNVTQAHRLQGKLLLIHGELDDNVHPASTMQVVDALIKANKDFDLLIVPGANHGVMQSRYAIRRQWDYFVRHLLGVDPPAGYQIPPPPS